MTAAERRSGLQVFSTNSGACAGCETMRVAVKHHNDAGKALLDASGFEMMTGGTVAKSKVVTEQEAKTAGAMSQYEEYDAAMENLFALKARCGGAETEYVDGAAQLICMVETE